MTRLPSLSSIVCAVVFGYIIYSVWSVAQIFIHPSCSPHEKCLVSYLHDSPTLDLSVFTSVRVEPGGDNDVTLVGFFKNFSYSDVWEK